jgi:hypothetical protein
MAKSKRRGMRKIKRGGSAWQYSQSVYGTPDQQHAVGILPNGGTNNMIAINEQQSGGRGNADPLNFSEYISGGNLPELNPSSFSDNNVSQQNVMAVSSTHGPMTHVPMSHSTTTHGPMAISGGKRRRRKGGNVLSEIALPATLLIANEIGKNATMNRGVYLDKTNKKKYRKKNNRTFRRR